MEKVIVLGDIHGDFETLNAINKYFQPDICISTGDFGYFPSVHGFESVKNIRTLFKNDREVKIYFIDGNHDNHDELSYISAKGNFVGVEIAKNIFYQPRGSVLELLDGRKLLLIGGAKSVDHKARSEGYSWWKDEVLLKSDLPEMLPKVDIVISHTAPLLFDLSATLSLENPPAWWDLSQDPSELVLDDVLNKVQPKLWICSHWHNYKEATYVGKDFTTKYYVLNCIRSPQYDVLSNRRDFILEI